MIKLLNTILGLIFTLFVASIGFGLGYIKGCMDGADKITKYVTEKYGKEVK